MARDGFDLDEILVKLKQVVSKLQAGRADRVGTLGVLHS